MSPDDVRCRRCGDPGEVTIYWDQEHMLCRSCCHAAAEYFDSVGRWPSLVAPDRRDLNSLDCGVPEWKNFEPAEGNDA